MNIQRLLIAVALVFGIAFSVQAQEKQPSDSTKVAKRDAAKTQKRETSKKETPSRKYPGLFTVYEDTTTGALQLQIRESQIGKEYIYFTHTVNAPVSAGTYRGNYRGSSVLSIQKHFDKIEIISENTAYYFDHQSRRYFPHRSTPSRQQNAEPQKLFPGQTQQNQNQMSIHQKLSQKHGLYYRLHL